MEDSLKTNPNAFLRYREKHGLTQKELASILHISIRSVQNYEAGKNTSPSILYHLKLLEAMQDATKANWL
jgi:transcriptional regulator with XRE-family HTH domain